MQATNWLAGSSEENLENIRDHKFKRSQLCHAIVKKIGLCHIAEVNRLQGISCNKRYIVLAPAYLSITFA